MSRVRVKHMSNGQVGTFSRERLVRSRTGVEKAAAWALLAVSWLGSIVTAHGGWAALVASPSLALTGVGLVAQAVLTYLQWSYPDVWWVAWPARAVDALLTALGYGFLFIGGLTLLLARTGLSLAPWPMAWFVVSVAGLVAWAIIYLISLGVAYYPESRLVT